ncbi:MbcA/ParS/Xre antitoxin family protein [Labrenzia sp. DG1229]|uniref:MbcA/ParS/Xre antitoxin family protein n=1 Tax=Labrenzia sp. DG1229 TaxID=681847 RepID=UPI0004905D08|nr:MbcA/ParS/Xre antitoxin family protein [Labrenzia sp. DG1229]
MPQLNPAVGSDAGAKTIPAMMEAFSNLADDWKLSTEEQIRLLGSPGRSTFFKWKKEGGNLPNDTIERISHLLGIYKCLQILLPDPLSADSWIKLPNKYFGDISALEHMMGGSVVDIYKVREYLDAQRGG